MAVAITDLPPARGVLESLIWVDYSILALIAISGVMGMIRGFVREVFALTTWGAGALVGMNFCKALAAHLEHYISVPSLRVAAAFVGLFVMTLLVGGIVGFLLSELVHRTGLSSTDRLLGLLFGVCRGAVIVAVVVFLAGFTPLPADPWWRESLLIPPFQRLAVWLKDIAPASLASYLNYR